MIPYAISGDPMIYRRLIVVLADGLVRVAAMSPTVAAGAKAVHGRTATQPIGSDGDFLGGRTNGATAPSEPIGDHGQGTDDMISDQAAYAGAGRLEPTAVAATAGPLGAA